MRSVLVVFFAAPAWLLGLVPLAALGVWLLTGARRRWGVPFLTLWKGAARRRSAKSLFQRPPPYLLAALFAAVLAIVGAACPTSSSSQRAVVIVDRGWSMSQLDGDQPRYVSAAERLAKVIPLSVQVDIIDAITGDHTPLSGLAWVARVRTLLRTGVDSRVALDAAVRSTAAESPVYALTDRPLEDRRVTVVAPPTFTAAVIEGVVVRDGAKPQAMVTVRNDSAAVSATLKLSCGGTTVTRTAPLPAAGDVSVFIDLPAAAERVEAQLGDGDDLGQRAYALRQGARTRCEFRSPVSEPLRRIAKVYDRWGVSRDADSTLVIALSGREKDLGGDVSAIEAEGVTPATGDLHVRTDALTSVVDWPRVLKDARVADGPREAGWEPLVTIGSKTVVARRTSPARQVWVGIDPARWSREPDYVVFWANAFQWLGETQPAWASEIVEMLPSDWTAEAELPRGVDPRAWPGFYRLTDGRERAFNVRGVSKDRLHVGGERLVSPARTGNFAWTGTLALAAVACMAVGGLCWPTRD